MAKNGPKNLEEKKQDLAFRRFAKVVDSITTVVHSLVRYGGVALPFFFMYKVAEVLAGKTTTADIGLKMFGSVTITETVGYGLGLAGTLYGLKERKLRRDKTEYLQDRIQKLEKQMDPNRSTSRLTKRGTTNPMDKE
ncbi:MAG: hypothetical protein HYR60_24050 [Acidobacteria bacterium]|nr:hypothetical protein [Acidobacteriota bacterium]